MNPHDYGLWICSEDDWHRVNPYMQLTTKSAVILDSRRICDFLPPPSMESYDPYRYLTPYEVIKDRVQRVVDSAERGCKPDNLERYKQILAELP